MTIAERSVTLKATQEDTMKKSEITWHSEGYSSRGTPAVNVKVHRFDPTDAEIDSVAADVPGFTREALDALDDDAKMYWWGQACELGWERLQDDAEHIYGPYARVYSEGRSSGWAILGYEYEKGRHAPGPSVEDVRGWDAIELSKWAKFARWARQTADDTPRQYAELVAINVFEPEQERRAYAADPQRQIEI